MLSFDRIVATHDEIRLGFSLLRAGLSELQKLQGMPSEFFVSFRLLSDGYERLLKMLFCLHQLDVGGAYPDGAILRAYPKTW